ncbi:MAG: hypothetical protein AAF629_01750 [Chloroflexota bacterium]
MPTLEVRRHSHRKTDGGSQLSQFGVSFAREIGDTMGAFSSVVTSVVPRTRETAIALGFAVDQELITLAPEEVYAELQAIDWTREPNPFTLAANLIRANGAYARYAHALAARWRDILTPLTEDERALFIGHSGELEAALVACFPNADHRSWGQPFGPLEGARLTFSGEPAYFSEVEVLRLPNI